MNKEEIILKIEELFKFKLYPWQKEYLFDEFEYGDYIPTGRKVGRTFIYMVKLCLSEGDPIKMYRWCDQQKHVDMYFKSQAAYNRWFVQELRYIYRALKSANFKLRTIYFTELEYRSRTKLML